MAFEHISATARRLRLLRMRAAFLADPTTYWEDGFNWARRLYPDRTVYVSSTGSSDGAGTISDPMSRAAWDAQQQAFSRVVFSGNFRNQNIVAREDHMTLDMRSATLSRGKAISFADITDVSSTSYTKADGTTATIPSLTYRVPAIKPSDSSEYIDQSDAYINVCVAGTAYRGLTGTHSANAGFIRIYSVNTSTNYLLVRVGWQLQVGERLAFLPTSSFSDPCGGLASATPYYVVAQTEWGYDAGGSYNVNSGYQKVQISATRGGAAITFTSGQAAALAPVGTRYARFFCLHELNTGAAIPNPSTLAVGEFAFCPWESALYFRASATLTSGHEVLVTSTQGAGISITGRTDVHVLGGTIYTSHRGILFDASGSVRTRDCGAWGVKVYGGLRGICLQTSPTGTITRFCEAAYGKYALSSEEATSGEAGTTHAYFYVHDVGNWIHNWADRQPLMINPQSTGGEFRDGLLEDCSIASFGAVTKPANQYAPNISTWGSAVNDASSSVVMRNLYFANCYGPNSYNNISGLDENDDPRVVSDVTIDRCIFDMRGMSAQDAKGAASIWTLAQTTGNSLTSVVATDNLHLLADIGQAVVFDGLQRAAGVLMASSRDSCAVDVQIRRSIVYGGSGTDSTLYMIQNLSETGLTVRPEVDADENVYCCPSVTHLMLGVTTDSGGTLWQTDSSGNNFYKVADVAMPTTPGASSTWTSGGHTNDGNSLVKTEDEMVAIGMGYSAWGEVMNATVKRPWFGPQE